MLKFCHFSEVKCIWYLTNKSSKYIYTTIHRPNLCCIFVYELKHCTFQGLNKPIMKTKYVCLYRVSTEQQRNAKGDYTDGQIPNKHLNTGLGLASQRTACKAFIQQNQGECIAEFEEIQSASNKDIIKFGKEVSLASLLNKRPVLLEAITYARENNAVLLVKECSRLTRFKLLGEYLMSTGIKFQCVDSPSDDNFIISIKIALFQQEAENVSKRTKAALAERIKRSGHWQKPNPEFMNGNIAKEARKVQTMNSLNNENNIKAASLVNLLRKDGMTLQVIADYLNKNKFYTARGKKFSITQVKRLLTKYSIDKAA